MLHKYQLPNGLKVILLPSHKAPVIAAHAWVRTGSADEQKGEEGISHFIEHLLFKGTRKFKVGEIASSVEGCGGELNAYTSFDQTVFHITLSKHFAPKAIESLADMMGFPSFDPQEIDNEREVVIEEIKRSNDNPQRAGSRLLFETVYKAHPYRIPVIGYEDNIRSFTPRQIQNYYQGRYSPQNMSLLVIGDFETPKMKSLVKSYFGEIPKSKVRTSRRKPEPKQKAPRVTYQASAFEETMAHIAFPVPGATHTDAPALDILALILGQGESSRLFSRLRLQDNSVNYIGSHAYTPADQGFFALSMGLKHQDLEQALTSIGEEILQIQLTPPSAVEVNKAIRILEADEIFGAETVDGLARKLGTFDQLFNQPTYYENYLKQLIRVTPNQVVEVARKYLKANVASVCIVGQKDAPDLSEIGQKFQADLELAQDLFRKCEPQKTGFKPDQIKIPKTKSSKTHGPIVTEIEGVRVVAYPDHQSPTVALRIGMLGGQRLETEKTAGLSEILSSTWLSGTKTKSEAEIVGWLDQNAVGLRAFSGRNTLGLSLNCLAQNFHDSLSLAFEALCFPSFPKEIVEREKSQQLESIRQKKDNPSQLAVEGFQKMLFGNHAYGRATSGTAESVTSIQPDHLQKYLQQVRSRKNLFLAVAGDIDMKALEKQLRQNISQLPLGPAQDTKSPIQKLTKDSSNKVILKKEQSHVVWGFEGINISDPRNHTLQLINSILAGQGGRLFLELRDKASLAYSVSPISMEGIESGFFGAYIGCSPDKVERALEMMKIEFDKLVTEKVSESELDRAKQYVLGRHDIGLQRNSSVASSLFFTTIYNQDVDQVFHLDKFLKDIEPKDIQSVAKEIFTRPTATMIVGPY